MGTRTRLRDATAARHAWRRADPLEPSDASGSWRIEHLGRDDVLRARAAVRRALGIGNLVGMRLEGSTAWHLVGRRVGGDASATPLGLEVGASAVDGRPTLVARAGPDLGALWRFARLELRRLDDATLVGVDLLGPVALAVPAPFLLHRDEPRSRP